MKEITVLWAQNWSRNSLDILCQLSDLHKSEHNPHYLVMMGHHESDEIVERLNGKRSIEVSYTDFDKLSPEIKPVILICKLEADKTPK